VEPLELQLHFTQDFTTKDGLKTVDIFYPDSQLRKTYLSKA